ncbi:hypothetical protein H112_01924 [Trichophyton rubrum D6]|uniref:Developmental regulator VelB n=4 Tax=Trichophyton TaxID=5550 RepID=A0A178EZ44_TRIRU|nr:uncharacterized protein TERG_06692 [Trichophyton rubrum CBS 118892]EZF25917.1 hypothetical protein H100_01920 [Trichophyton rubrum MR850]EZF44893.1 hypothetical protein H102_01918 [Trichophyton rubrum CBS 100081]EZF55546.1 hypothetical protein H103_01929 [Trichophyton rubrum CBS 288.86]EZF66126.1 hypothetical protein H104_01904 [Trichophyton rubrum CBS 289.86]EZF76747.1 hypothetical protein H105_01934 [Trichophyton soudanense CBS 452.61]EZF87403.1 hypothetical protein H110_01927 [Trichophy
MDNLLSQPYMPGPGAPAPAPGQAHPLPHPQHQHQQQQQQQQQQHPQHQHPQPHSHTLSQIQIQPQLQPPSQAQAPITLPPVWQPHPEPEHTSLTLDGFEYVLEVVQQPIRARMCGFGDKDRRPITPPPCVRLIVRDATTKQEVEADEIDTTFFVLTVDLWNAEGDREVNLVRHSATSPSISTATSSSFPPPAQNMAPTGQAYSSYQHQSMYNQPPPTTYSYYPTQSYAAQAGMPYPAPQSGPAQSYYPHVNQGYYTSQSQQPVVHHLPPAPVGMFTRNLIGSLSASAFKLSDPAGKLGIWFILQDLSVRTEGMFRLKMNFVNVGTPQQALSRSGNTSSSTPVLNHGSAPVLASVYSDVLQVFSAKKFPGVIESTPLSKCFAIQGIKIPIRKDGVKGGRGGGAAMMLKGDDGDGDEQYDE